MAATAARGSVIDELFVKVGYLVDQGSIDRSIRGIDVLKNRLNRAAAGFTKIGLAGAGAVFDITRTTMSLDGAMKLLAAKGPELTERQLDFLRNQAIEVAAKIGLNAADVVDAQTKLKQLGFTYQEITGMTPGVANVAFATKLEGVTTEDVAKYAAIIRNVWEVPIDQVSEKLDAMIVTAQNSPAAFKELGESFQYSAQSAKNAEQSFESWLATLAGFARSGRAPEAASQGLQNIISKLSKAVVSAENIEVEFRGTEIVKKAMAAANLTAQNILGAWQTAKERKADPVNAVLAMVKEAVGDDKEALTAIMSVLGGESYAPALAAHVQNLDKHAELTKKAENAVGAANLQSAKMMTGLKGRWELLKSSYDRFKIRLGESGTDTFLTRVMEWAIKLLDELTRLDSQGRLVHGNLLTLTATALSLGAAFLGVAAAIKGVTIALSVMQGAMAFTKFFAATQVLTEAGKVKYVLDKATGKAVPMKGPSQFSQLLSKIPGLGAKAGKGIAMIGRGAARSGWLAAIYGTYKLSQNLDKIAEWSRRADWSWDWLKEGLSGIGKFLDEMLLGIPSLLLKGLMVIPQKIADAIAAVYGAVEGSLRRSHPELARQLFGTEQKTEAAQRHARATAGAIASRVALREAEGSLPEYQDAERAAKEAMDVARQRFEAADKAYIRGVESGVEDLEALLADRNEAETTLAGLAEKWSAASSELFEATAAVRKYADEMEMHAEDQRTAEKALALARETPFKAIMADIAARRKQRAQMEADARVHATGDARGAPEQEAVRRRFYQVRPGLPSVPGPVAPEGLDFGFVPKIPAAPVGGASPAPRAAQVTVRNEVNISQDITSDMTPEEIIAITRKAASEGIADGVGRALAEEFNSEVAA